jgi:hypothetical protein
LTQSKSAAQPAMADQIYTHLMKRPGLGAKSPFDAL